MNIKIRILTYDFEQTYLNKKKKIKTETKQRRKNPNVDTNAEKNLQSSIYDASHLVFKWNKLKIR